MKDTLFARVTWPMAVAQTLFWAGSFYVFHPLLPRFEAHFGWQRAEVALGLTLSLCASALVAPFAGLLIDRGLGRALVGTGGVVASGALLALGAVETLSQFYVVWVVLGVCHGAILYEPCFAILTRIFKNDAKRAITRVALMAGFAGSISFPLGHYLSEAIGWERALWIFALMCLAATGLALAALTGTRALDAVEPAPEHEDRSALAGALRTPVFWLLAAAFAMVSLNHGVLLPHLLPLLTERGVSSALAVLAASTIGPMQVVGRIVMVALERRVSVSMVTAVSFVAVAMASLALLLQTQWAVLLFVFVLMQGAGYGVTSITRPAVTAQCLGQRGFGSISGTLAIPFIAAFAAGPTLGALIWSAFDYDTVLVCTCAAAVLGLVLFALAMRRSRAVVVSTDLSRGE